MPPRRSVAQGLGHRLPLIISSAVAAAAVLLLTDRFGPGMSPDSAFYYSAARSLVAGTGFRTFDGGVYALWPPAFPVLLALGEWIGAGVHETARWVNALSHAGTAVLGSLHVAATLRRRSVAWAVAGAIAFAPPLVRVATMAWSEPLFILSSVGSLVALHRYRRSGRNWTLALAIFAAALAALTRYIGITVVLSGAIVIAFSGSGRRLNLRGALRFGALALAPLLVWMMRNLNETGSVTGPRSSDLPAGDQSIFVSDAAAVGALLLAMIAVASLVLAHRLPATGTVTDREGVVTAAIHATFSLVYLLALLPLSAAGASNPIDYRLLSPLIPSALIVATLLGVGAVPRLPRRHAVAARASIALGVLGATVAVAPSAIRESRSMLSLGAGGYSSPGWAGSPLLRHIRGRGGDALIYSNAAEGVYLWGGGTVVPLPRKYEGFSRRIDPDSRIDLCRTLAGSAQPVLLAWFHHAPYAGGMYTPGDLQAFADVDPLAQFRDGRLYRLGRCRPRVGSPQT